MSYTYTTTPIFKVEFYSPLAMSNATVAYVTRWGRMSGVYHLCAYLINPSCMIAIRDWHIEVDSARHWNNRHP